MLTLAKFFLKEIHRALVCRLAHLSIGVVSLLGGTLPAFHFINA